jgi:hypothetical protein
MGMRVVYITCVHAFILLMLYSNLPGVQRELYTIGNIGDDDTHTRGRL